MSGVGRSFLLAQIAVNRYSWAALVFCCRCVFEMRFPVFEFRWDFHYRLPAGALLFWWSLCHLAGQTPPATSATRQAALATTHAAPAHLTAEQDHQRLMDLLGIKRL